MARLDGTGDDGRLVRAGEEQELVDLVRGDVGEDAAIGRARELVGPDGAVEAVRARSPAFVPASSSGRTLMICFCIRCLQSRRDVRCRFFASVRGRHVAAGMMVFVGPFGSKLFSVLGRRQRQIMRTRSDRALHRALAYP
jgi:hypothetical protein